MSGGLYLAWRYLARHKLKTAILVVSIALIAFLPVGLRVLVGESAAQGRDFLGLTPKFDFRAWSTALMQSYAATCYSPGSVPAMFSIRCSFLRWSVPCFHLRSGLIRPSCS